MKKYLKIIVLIFLIILSNCEEVEKFIDSIIWIERGRAITVPFRTMDQPDYCGAACVQMWGLFSGAGGTPQHIIAAAIGAPTYMEYISYAVGIYTNDFSEYSSFMETESGQDQAIGLVASSLDEYHPAILPSLSSHVILATGTKWEQSWLNQRIRGVEYRFHDPATGQPDAWITIDNLKRIYFTPYENPFESGPRYRVVWYLGSRTQAEVEAKYQGFLESNGTYYGGPDVYIPEGSTFLRVGYPIGGDILAKRKTDQIRWEANGLSGQIKLELYKNDSFAGTIAANLPIGNGSYDWIVGDYLNGSVQTGDDYKIKVSMMDESYDDFSNVDFSIGDVNITVPNGGETWEQGSFRDITWDSSYFTGNVQLILVKTVPGTDYIIVDNIENTGSYQWQVGMCSHIDDPDAPFGMALPGDCYKIKVVSVDNADLKDTSDELFSIVGPPTITVNAPNGGENWQAGATQTITWAAPGVAGDLKISLWRDEALVGNIISVIDPVLGSYSWTVGQYEGGAAVVGAGYKIRIRERETTNVDDSDALFTIKGIVVTSPNGGENWQIGAAQTITWTAPGVTGDLKISLWRDDVLVGNIISVIDPILGSYSWTVGQYEGGTAVVGAGYKIRIRERETTNVDDSDTAFSLSN